MTIIEEGKFQLYSHITPALKADDYRFTVRQDLSAKKGSETLDEDDLPVDSLTTHVRVTAPRFQLPPDQVLSTFPPAGSEGAYGSRLPQVVIKRRTLPWERGLTRPGPFGEQIALPDTTPWLALVLIAEGEAELLLNEDAADCVTSDVELDGELDVAKGNCLLISKSVLERVLPTQLDVPLLAHARQVDIHDTELMMGDDDGFLSVVIANRLPVPGTDAQGNSVPVKYMACLINLEGQFHRLIPKAPAHRDVTDLYGVVKDVYVDAAVFDHVKSGEYVEHWTDPHVNPIVLDDAGQVLAIGNDALRQIEFEGGFLAESADGPAPLATDHAKIVGSIQNASAGSAAYTASKGHTSKYTDDIYVSMVEDFAKVKVAVTMEPKYRFPVLLHWSFVSTGDVTFEYLMRHLDSGMLGTGPEKPYDETGREPLEVVETGHVGLVQRTRVGDTTRAWYRGPLLPHPTSGERLPIAHSSDQLRAVVADSREDISLAAAFEIGRLLALSRPSMVAALLRWRQTQFQVARAGGIFDKSTFPFPDMVFGPDFRYELESKLRHLIVVNPDDLLGPHRTLITPGDPIDWGGEAYDLVAKGFGLDLDLTGGFESLEGLMTTSQQLGDMAPLVVETFDNNPAVVGPALTGALDRSVEQVMSNVLANEIVVDPVFGSSVLRGPELGNVVIIDGGILDASGGVITRDTIGIDPGGVGGVIDGGAAPGGVIVDGGTGPGGVIIDGGTGPGGVIIDGGTGPGGVVIGGGTGGSGPGGVIIDGGIIGGIGGLLNPGGPGAIGGLGVVTPRGPLADESASGRRRRRRRGEPDALDRLLARGREDTNGDEQ
jgi:hypothetical protein